MRISDWSSDVCSSDLATTIVISPSCRRHSSNGAASAADNLNRHRTSSTWTTHISANSVRSPKSKPRIRLATPGRSRSEEHTSELQSLMRISYAVFCLQKKNRPRQETTHKHLTNKPRIYIKRHITPQ